MASVRELQFQWHQRGYSFSVLQDPPQVRYGMILHTTDGVFMLLKSEASLTLHGETQYPNPDEEINIPANTTYTVRNIGLTENCWCFGSKH